MGLSNLVYYDREREFIQYVGGVQGFSDDGENSVRQRTVYISHYPLVDLYSSSVFLCSDIPVEDINVPIENRMYRVLCTYM